jgi:hypothetical protein
MEKATRSEVHSYLTRHEIEARLQELVDLAHENIDLDCLLENGLREEELHEYEELKSLRPAKTKLLTITVCAGCGHEWAEHHGHLDTDGFGRTTYRDPRPCNECGCTAAMED